MKKLTIILFLILLCGCGEIKKNEQNVYFEFALQLPPSVRAGVRNTQEFDWDESQSSNTNVTVSDDTPQMYSAEPNYEKEKDNDSSESSSGDWFGPITAILGTGGFWRWMRSRESSEPGR